MLFRLKTLILVSLTGLSLILSGCGEEVVDDDGFFPFSILGIQGGSDGEPDQWLTADADPRVHWEPSLTAIGYKVQIKDQAGSTVVCPEVNTTNTHHTFTGCALTQGGHYKAYVNYSDPNGNVVPAKNDGYEFVYDSQAPTVSMTGQPNDPSSDTNPSFTFTSTDSGSGIAGTMCQHNGGGFLPCTSPHSLVIVTTGAHTFEVQGIDGAGNLSAIQSYTWTVNPAAPGPFNILGVRGGADITDDAFLTDGSQPHVFYESATFATSYDITVKDSAGTVDVCSLQSSVTTDFDFAGCSLTEGLSYQVIVTADDGSGGRTDASNSPYSLTVDSVGPVTSIDSAPPVTSTDANPSFIFSAVDATSSVGGYECQLDGGGFSACASPKSYTSLADGAHTFEVRSTDIHGNVGAVISHNWTIDGNPPGPFNIDGVIGGADVTKDGFLTEFVQPEIHWQASTDATNYDVFIKDEAGTSDICSESAVAGLSHQFVGCPLVEGTSYKILVVAKDAVGNPTNATNSLFTLVLDSVDPMASIDSAPDAVSSSDAPSFQFSATDAGSGVDHYECQLDGGGFSTCTSPKSYTSVADGPHTFEVIAYDAAGNPSATQTHNWTIDTSPPGAFTVDGTIGGSDVALDDYLTDFVQPKISWQASVGATDYDVFIKDNAGTVDVCVQLDVVGTEHQFVGCAIVEGTSYKVRVVAKDDADNPTTATNDLKLLMVDSVEPVVSFDAQPDADSNDTTPTFQFSAVEATSGLDYFECQLDGGGFALCSSPETLLPLTEGSHTFEVKAFDVAGNESAVVNYTWNVDTTLPDPFNISGVDGGSDVTVDGYLTDGVTAKINWTASAGQSDYEVTVRDAGDTVDVCAMQTTSDESFTFSGCTLVDETAYRIKVEAVDAATNRRVATNSPFVFIVDSTAPVLAFTSVPPATDTQASLDIEFTATDGGSGVASLECEFDGGGYAACTSPHNLSGVTAGAHSFSVRAVDAAGNAATTITHNWTTIAGAYISLSDAPSYDFGTRGMGSVFERTVTLENTGVMDALNISESTLASPFRFKNGSFDASGTCGTTLNTGASCTVIVEYAPDVSGAVTETMTFDYDDGTNNLSSQMDFSGTGQPVAANVINNLQVIVARTFDIEIAWSAPFDNYTPITDYIVEYKESSSGTWLLFNDGVSAGLTATVTGLTASTSYDFRVSSTNGIQSAPSNIATGETAPDDPFFESGVYKAMNIGGATASSVAAMDDTTEIKLNGAVIATLNAGETHSFTSALNDVIEADKPIFVAGRLGASGANDRDKGNMVWSPPDWAGKKFVFTGTRLNPHKVTVFAFEDANITVKKGAATVATQFVAEDGNHTFSIADDGGFEINSDGLIIANFYSSSGSAVADPKPLLPASTDIIGFPSTKAMVTSLNSGTNYNAYHSDSTTSTGSLTAGTEIQINPQGTSQLYQSHSLRIIADDKIVANSNADSNGYCSAPFLPVPMMRKRYVLNVQAEWVAFASIAPGDITVTAPGGGTSTLTLTRSGSDPNAPYRVRTTNVAAGTRFDSTIKYGAWYEPIDNTDAADNDETIMFGSDD